LKAAQPAGKANRSYAKDIFNDTFVKAKNGIVFPV
jgi:hypothetical protein